MKFSTSRPEQICWITVPLLLLPGLLTYRQSVDLYLHDTYFVISNLHLGVLFGLGLSLLGLGYWLVQKTNGNLFRLLSIIHLWLTLGGVLSIMLLVPLMSTEANMQAAYHPVNYLLLAALTALVLGQPLYILNLLIGSLRRKK